MAHTNAPLRSDGWLYYRVGYNHARQSLVRHAARGGRGHDPGVDPGEIAAEALGLFRERPGDGDAELVARGVADALGERPAR